ncbi:MAG: TldD/PmbA family protein [Bacillota bacterium]|nr:TldD/PmbA family protein [Bacillota bacterium]
MKARLSPFLTECKPIVKKLLQALQKDFPYVSILGTDTFGTSFRVQRAGVSVEDSMWNERGFVVRVHNGINYSEFSFNDLKEETLSDISAEIKAKIAAQIQEFKGLSVGSYPLIQEDASEVSFCGEVRIHPSAVSTKDKLSRMQEMMNGALKLSEELVDFRVVYNEVEISKIFVSSKKELEQAYIISEGSLFAIVRRGEKTKFDYSSYSGLKAVELLDEMEAGVEEVVKGALELLDAEPVIPGEYEVICTPKITGLIVHEAFGHGVEMDMFVKNRAKAVEYLGKQVASPLITMRDGAAAAKDMSSYSFDDEGTLAGDTVIIKDGILQTGISDLLSAMKLGTKPTGNGKRQSFERKAYTRMTNTFFISGDNTFEEMLSTIKHGYLLDGMMSGMEDPKNWGIQCMLVKGREIVDGAFTGKVVSPVILTGYVPDLLNSISMVSKDFELYGAGFCGKGYKEYVKVSDGGPYIKAKARLG